MKKYLFFSGILFIATSFLYNTEAIEGFYKDVFEDEGTGLSGANLDRNCKYIGFTMERLNTNSDLTKQAEIMIENDNDDNGYLLYPDGEPRFAIIYYHGGYMAHSSNLGEEGRERIRCHYYNGGSQFGSAAGSYMLSSSNSTYFRLWPGRMNGPNCSTTKLDYEIPVNSPLLNY